MRLRSKTHFKSSNQDKTSDGGGGGAQAGKTATSFMLLDGNHQENPMGAGGLVDPSQPSRKSFSNLYLEGSPVRKHENGY
jgi:hypothetical protein